MECFTVRILFGSSNQGRWDGSVMWHAWGRRIMHVGFWWRNLKRRNHLEDLGTDGMIVLPMSLIFNGIGGHWLDSSGWGEE